MSARPTQEEVHKWVQSRWPNHVSPLWRAVKLGEEVGEVLGAVIKMDEGDGRKSVDDVRLETAQVVICAMALAAAAGFDLDCAVADEWSRLSESVAARAVPAIQGSQTMTTRSERLATRRAEQQRVIDEGADRLREVLEGYCATGETPDRLKLYGDFCYVAGIEGDGDEDDGGHG